MRKMAAADSLDVLPALHHADAHLRLPSAHLIAPVTSLKSLKKPNITTSGLKTGALLGKPSMALPKTGPSSTFLRERNEYTWRA